MNEDPDTFWNWRLHNIDETEWEIKESQRSPHQFYPMWFLIGGIVGILWAVMS